MFNILTEDLIRYKRDDGAVIKASLPRVYAALMADDIESFPALRPHQTHAWHAFLAQLGAIATHKAGLTEPPQTSDEWLRIIPFEIPGRKTETFMELAISVYDWHLVIDDITKPAFMQPPATSEYRLPDYKKETLTPEDLDILVISKKHDLKLSPSGTEIDDWLFALLTTQTMGGYAGGGTYGISRMPSGYGNRPAFSTTPSTRWGIHVKRDILALLECRQEIVDDYGYPPSGGFALMWTLPWDGEKSAVSPISQTLLDPFYIEICRRVRLKQEKGKTLAIRASSKSRRIADVKGLTGDPWAPVSNKRNPNGTPPGFLGPRRFDYGRVVDGLFSSDWKQPHLLRFTTFDEEYEELLLVARGIVRGEGGTAGYHERVIPMRRAMAESLKRESPEAERLKEIAEDRISQIDKVKKILRHAVATFAARGNSDFAAHRNGRPSPNDMAQTYVTKLDRVVDATFFSSLQDELEEVDAVSQQILRDEWLLPRSGEDGVINHARAILHEAQDSLPSNEIHRYTARSRAESIFEGGIRGEKRGLPHLFSKNPDASRTT